MFARRGANGEGRGLVAKAACVFVSLPLLLLVYVLGRPVRQGHLRPPQARCAHKPAGCADILVAVRESGLLAGRRCAQRCASSEAASSEAAASEAAVS
jgi:hypothetical protein